MFDITLFDIQQYTTETEMMQLKNRKYIGMDIHGLSNMTARYMDNYGHKNLVSSIVSTNGWILGFIDHSEREGIDVFQRDIEEKFNITRSTVSKVVNLMVQKGLIERSPVEYDARLKKLTLTDKSRELADFIHADNEMMDAILTDGFSDEEKNQLVSYLQRMKNNLKNKFEANGEDPYLCFPIKKEE